MFSISVRSQEAALLKELGISVQNGGSSLHSQGPGVSQTSSEHDSPHGVLRVLLIEMPTLNSVYLSRPDSDNIRRPTDENPDQKGGPLPRVPLVWPAGNSL